MIHFELNGKPRDGRQGMTLAELLLELDLSYQRLAVEVNEDVIPKSGYDSKVIQEGDRIEVVSFVGGG